MAKDRAANNVIDPITNIKLETKMIRLRPNLSFSAPPNGEKIAAAPTVALTII